MELLGLDRLLSSPYSRATREMRGAHSRSIRNGKNRSLTKFLLTLVGILTACTMWVNIKSTVNFTPPGEGAHRSESSNSGLSSGPPVPLPPHEPESLSFKANEEPPVQGDNGIAYAISITSCPHAPKGEYSEMYQGAAVLAHSIELAQGQSKKYKKYKLYAIIHEDAANQEGECVEWAKELGYEPMIVPTPINVDEIQHDSLRQKIPNNGCCGEKELIKFYAYTLTSHSLAVHLDIDYLVLRPFDALFDGIVNGDAKAYYTFDYNMQQPGKQPGVQGGFLVLKPDKDAFDEFNRIVLTKPFTASSGWDNSRVGGFYGGMTFQGLLPYFYVKLHPDDGIEVDRCLYNTMVDNPRTKPSERFPEGQCRTGEDTCKDCRVTDISDIYSAHFTICQKPWHCMNHEHMKQPYAPLCSELHKKWHKTRRLLEEKWGTYDTTKYTGNNHEGFCRGGGQKGYIDIPRRRWVGGGTE